MNSTAGSTRAPRSLRVRAAASSPAGRGGERPRAQAPAEVVSRRLRSRVWRTRNSAWLLLPVLGLPWLAFLYAGVRVGRARWVAAAVGYLLAAGASATALAVALGSFDVRWVLLALVLGAGTWGGGVVHSFVANSTWLRLKAALTGEPSAPPTPAEPVEAAPPVPADPVEALQVRLRETVRTANRAGGRLPDGAVPLVREVEDVLRPLLAHVARRGAGAEELHHLTAIVEEYLPGALERYLDLPEQYALTSRGPSGTTPAEELVNQLRLLVGGAQDLQRAVYDHDAQQLRAQGSFLDAKFRRSDLDL